MNIASPQHAVHAAGLTEALALKATAATPPAERPPRTPELQRIIELEDEVIELKRIAEHREFLIEACAKRIVGEERFYNSPCLHPLGIIEVWLTRELLDEEYDPLNDPQPSLLDRGLAVREQATAAELATLRNMVYTRDGVMAMLKRHWKDIYQKAVQQ